MSADEPRAHTHAETTIVTRCDLLPVPWHRAHTIARQLDAANTIATSLRRPRLLPMVGVDVESMPAARARTYGSGEAASGCLWLFNRQASCGSKQRQAHLPSPSMSPPMRSPVAKMLPWTILSKPSCRDRHAVRSASTGWLECQQDCGGAHPAAAADQGPSHSSTPSSLDAAVGFPHCHGPWLCGFPIGEERRRTSAL